MNEESALTTVKEGSTPSFVSVYSNIEAFESAQRMVASLAASDVVPLSYRGQKGLANGLVALDTANRMGLSVVQVMQSLNVIHGRPSWSSQFIIAQIQGCGRFENFDYDVKPESCRCHAIRRSDGKKVEGDLITMDMARKEGWTKNSKWQTMPQTMLRYRAASSFGRFYIPDLLLGFRSVEENEVIDAEVAVVPAATESTLDKVQDLLAPKSEPVQVPTPEPISDVPEPDDFFD